MKRAFDPQEALRELVRTSASDRFDIAIDYAGEWFYQGSRIDRIELVRLFATVLHRASDGKYWLITPVERGRIEVADSPFVIVDVEPGPVFHFRDNLDRTHALRHDGQLVLEARNDDRGDVPYLTLEGGLRARLLPKVYYELVELAEESHGKLGFRSDRRFFSLGAVA